MRLNYGVVVMLNEDVYVYNTLADKEDYYYYYHYSRSCEFFTSVLTDGFHRTLSNSKSIQFSRVLQVSLPILTLL